MFLVPIHIAAGLAGVATGLVAIGARKGSSLHRRSGQAFVAAMLAMTASAVVMAAFFFPNRTNLVAGSLTFYLVCTGLLAVRRDIPHARALETGFMVLACAVSTWAFAIGFEVLETPATRWMSIPIFLFGVTGWLGAVGDARTLRTAVLDTPRRLARHLWRMGFATWIATASLFLGQARHFPEPLRHAFGLRALPVLWVLGMIGYWLVKLRLQRRSSRASRIDTSARTGGMEPGRTA